MLICGRLLIDPDNAPPEPGWAWVEHGRIAEMGFGDPPRDAPGPMLGGRDAVICPAFTDAHMHLPQIDSAGCDGLELLEWLERVIFPAESWWGRGQGPSMARTAVRRMLTQGTGAFAGYLTSHGEINRRVVEWLARTPMRFIVGRVAMDRHAPDDLIAEDRARAASRHPTSPAMAGLGADDRHRVSVNPRFAVSCSTELLAEAGWWAREHPLAFIQTHLAESRPECDMVRRLFPEEACYTSVYDRAGLLGPRTLLAHGVHLSDDEWRLIVARGSIVVHCPAANIFLRSGLFDWHAAVRHGARVALGSDMAAGSDLAMPRVARGFIETAKVRAMALDPSCPVPTPGEAWRMITRGNADLLGWHEIGRLEAGASADLLVLRVPETWIDEHLVGRLIYNWSSRLIEARVLGGVVAEPDTL